jgi:hypothetical protein
MNKDKALQMCLEYIETDKHERKYVRHAIKAALEQPEQEPVTCRFCHSKKGCWAWQCYHCGEIDDVQQPTPPAAQPVQRPWVGLTPEEVQFYALKHRQLVNAHYDAASDTSIITAEFEAIVFYETVMQALKERNT